MAKKMDFPVEYSPCQIIMAFISSVRCVAIRVSYTKIMEFDDILNKIGGFGRVQVVLYILLGIIGIPCAMQNLGMVFFGASMDHWCKVDKLAFLPPEQVRTISAVNGEDGELDGCSYYDLDYSSYTNETLQNWNRTLMLTNLTADDTKQCDSWFYDYSQFKSTVRSKVSIYLIFTA